MASLARGFLGLHPFRVVSTSARLAMLVRQTTPTCARIRSGCVPEQLFWRASAKRCLSFSAAVHGRLPQQPYKRLDPTTASSPTTRPPVPTRVSPQRPPQKQPDRTQRRTPSLAEQLGRSPEPTVLYRAPSHFWLRLAGLTTGAFCVLYAIVNYWSVYVRPRPGLAWWVPHAFALVCVTMAALGAYFVSSGGRIVQTIRAVPTAQLAAIAGPGAASRLGASGLAATPIVLSVEIARVLPLLLPPRTLYLLPADVALEARLAPFGVGGPGPAGTAGMSGTALHDVPLDGRARLAALQAEEARRQAARAYEMDHIMTAPFRHAAKGVRWALQESRRGLSRSGFIGLEAGGRRLRLDVTGGWALENGRALDRLVRLKRS